MTDFTKPIYESYSQLLLSNANRLIQLMEEQELCGYRTFVFLNEQIPQIAQELVAMDK